MNIRIYSLVFSMVLAAAFATDMFAQSAGDGAQAQKIQLRLHDGTRWRGAVGDFVTIVVRQRGSEARYSGEIVAAGGEWIQVYTEIMGQMRKRTIANADILSIESSEPPAAAEPERRGGGSTGRRPTESVNLDESSDFKGVFYLPWKGGVGQTARHHEIKAIIEEADKHGRGQIIILDIDSPGGSVAEMQLIAETLQDGNKRHRIIAWVRQAISAGAATAANCHEIYFATEGSLGAITMLMGGGQSVGPVLQARNSAFIGQWFEAAGRPAFIAHAMIHADRELSYDKDPETGRVTWHPDLSGDYVLSEKGQNLVFNSQNAVHSNFAQGVADTYEDLAKLLDFPGGKWKEVNDVGRRLHDSWVRTFEDAQEQIRLAQFRFGNPVGRDAVERLGYQKRQLEEMMKWYERIGYSREDLEGLRRQIREIEKQIADLRRRR